MYMQPQWVLLDWAEHKQILQATAYYKIFICLKLLHLEEYRYLNMTAEGCWFWEKCTGVHWCCRHLESEFLFTFLGLELTKGNCPFSQCLHRKHAKKPWVCLFPVEIISMHNFEENSGYLQTRRNWTMWFLQWSQLEMNITTHPFLANKILSSMRLPSTLWHCWTGQMASDKPLSKL